MDGEDKLIDDQEAEKENLEEPAAPVSQKDRVASVEDLVRDAISSLEKNVGESTNDEQGNQRDVNSVNIEIDAEIVDDKNDKSQKQNKKQGKRETVMLRPLNLSGKSKEDDKEALIEPGSPRIIIEREVFTQKTFDEHFEPGLRPSPSIPQRTKRKLSKYYPSPTCCQNFITTMFPFLANFKNYKIKTYLPGDIVGGLTVGIMHLPQGMAYADLARLPPVYGLYLSFFPVLVYFFFGSSKHLSIGSFAVACLMIGETVKEGLLAEGFNPDRGVAGNNTNTTNTTQSPVDNQNDLPIRISYAVSLTFMTGIIQLIMGITRLGFLTVYLSDPLISGFTSGAACHVFTSQIKHVFGLKAESDAVVFKLGFIYADFFKQLPNTNVVTLLTSVVCITVLYSVSRHINQNPKLKPKMFMPVPTELIVVVLGTVVSYFAKFETEHKVKVVGDVPRGLPAPKVPFDHLGFVVKDAIPLAIVIFAISISMGKLLAKKHEYEIDSNQELMAFGISNCVASFFASPAASASMSRSLVLERVGGKTQAAAIFSSSLLLVVLLALGPYFQTLPKCVLASVVIVALRGLFLQLLDLPKLWAVSVIDFFVFVVAFLATVVLDVKLGLAVAVVFALLTIVARSQRPYTCLLGRIPGTDIYTDINVYKEAQEIIGVKIFRFEYALFFVNTEHFRAMLYKLTFNPRTLKMAQRKREKKLAKKQSQASLKADAKGGLEVEVPEPEKPQENDVNESKISVICVSPVMNPPDCKFHTIILDCSSWGFVDTMGVKVLISTIAEYKAVGIRVFLAKCKAGVREMFEQTRFYESVDRHHVYITVHDAVQHSIYEESPIVERKPFIGESHA